MFRLMSQTKGHRQIADVPDQGCAPFRSGEIKVAEQESGEEEGAIIKDGVVQVRAAVKRNAKKSRDQHRQQNRNPAGRAPEWQT